MPRVNISWRCLCIVNESVSICLTHHQHEFDGCLRKKKAQLCIKGTNSISSHLNNTAAKIEETFMDILYIFFFFLRVLENSKPLLFKSPLQSLQVQIKFRVYLISLFPRSFISLFVREPNQLSDLNRSIPSFFWRLSPLSKKPLADSSELVCNLLLALSSLKLFVPAYDPTTFPQIRLSWVCVNRKLA